jgi:hypothetical protein
MGARNWVSELAFARLHFTRVGERYFEEEWDYKDKRLFLGMFASFTSRISPSVCSRAERVTEDWRWVSTLGRKHERMRAKIRWRWVSQKVCNWIHEP